MLDIVGHLKINEQDEQRVKFFFASLKSCYKYKNICKISINLEDPSDDLFEQVTQELATSNCNFHLGKERSSSYGDAYMKLLNMTHYPYILNFIEDHFCIATPDKLKEVISSMSEFNVDICKSTFFQVEQHSIVNVQDITENKYGKYYLNTNKAHKEFSRHYKDRYYIGVNFIVTREFARKFWNRPLTKRPHEYEFSEYTKDYEHTCMVPNIEIQASIDDDHGESNSCLLKRGVKEFNNIWKIL